MCEQIRIVLRNAGNINPENIEDYLKKRWLFSLSKSSRIY